MPTGATGQLGLALPVQGELSGTWGNTVNNAITEYTNIAIAATLTLTGDGAVTLANTTGTDLATNIVSSLTGAGTVTAQFAIVRVTGTLTTTKVVTFGSAGLAPYSKTYLVVNAATGGSVSFTAYGGSGVTVAVGESAYVYYNGTNIVKVAGTTSGSAGGSNTQVQYNSSGALAGSANMTFDGTSLTLANGASIQGLTVGRGAGAVSSNTAVGASALAVNTTGADNTALGLNALASNNSGINNTASGRFALTANTTGVGNTASGYSSLATNISGSYNTASGGLSLYANTGSYNTAMGYDALNNNTASNNTAVGYQAGFNNVGGDYLTVVGSQAGKGNTTGRFNTALGRDALLTNSTSDDNTAVGTNALKLTTGAGNTALGSNALGVNSTGVRNTGVGNGVLTRHTTGSNNVGLGADALSFSLSGDNNVAVGYQAGYNINTGGNNTTIGHLAGYSITTGSYNVAIGRLSMDNSAGVTGDQNTAVGNGTLRVLTSGANNVSVGSGALQSTTTGSSNTGLGHHALLSNTTASNNTAVGYQAGYTATTNSYNVFLGYQAGYTSNYNGNGFNTCVGAQTGYSLTTGVGNTFIGGASTASGYFVTSGSDNTILGGYTGNAGGLDIRTANNYIVLSDGDGNPRGVFNNSGAFGLNGANYGAAGQILQSNGSSAVPTWVTASSGALVYISQVVASGSSTVSFTGLTAYDNYMIIFSKVYPDSSGNNFLLTTSVNNGSSYASSSYKWNISRGQNNTTAISGLASNLTEPQIQLSGDNLASSQARSNISGQIILNLKNSTSVDFFVWGQTAEINDSDNLFGQSIFGYRTETSATNAVRFKFASGNIATGTFRL